MCQPNLASYRGTYRGLSPTDESAIAMGEAQLVIGTDEITFSLAAGHEVVTERFPVTDLEPMTAEEVKAQFKEGSDVPREITGAFKGRFNDFPKLLFFKDQLIMWLGGMGDILGPTMLVGPGLWPRLRFWIGAWILDFRTGGGFPRFLYGGKARKYR